MYCKVHVAQIIIIEYIDNIITGALEVFLSVYITVHEDGVETNRDRADVAGET